MSKFADAASTSHTLSLAAMEEASRLGQRTADIDHLLLALVLSEQTAGQVLRSFGIDLAGARDAVAAQHAEHLAAVGVHAPAPEPGGIVFHETDGYTWSDRALALIGRASSGDRRGDATAVLRELVAEPSGMIEATLVRLGTSPAAVTARLDEVERTSPHRPQRPIRPGELSGSSEAFIPAAPDAVWAVLADPARMPEWEPSIGGVSNAPAAIRVGDTWAAHARTERPDGKPIRVKPAFIDQVVELVAASDPHLIEWRFSYPDAPRANARRLRIQLEPAAGGTQLRIALAWERHPDRARRPLLGLLMRPVVRLVLWLQLSQLGSGISRVFR